MSKWVGGWEGGREGESHFIQDKLEISIHLSLDKVKES